MKVNNAEFANMRGNTYLTENEIEKDKKKADGCSAYLPIRYSKKDFQ